MRIFRPVFILILGTTMPLWLFIGCGISTPDTQNTDGTFGQVHLALGFEDGEDDVEGFLFEIWADEELVINRYVPLEEENLPQWLLEDGEGDNHRFSDGLFVLGAGIYTARAFPMKSATEPSESCEPVQTVVEVIGGETAEIKLIANCEGLLSGGLDVAAGLNHPPVIDDLILTPGKFIYTCEPLDIEVIAHDPDGDDIYADWEVTAGPDDAVFEFLFNGSMQAGLTVQSEGPYTVRVEVFDHYGTSAYLEFPVHVTRNDDLCENPEEEVPEEEVPEEEVPEEEVPEEEVPEEEVPENLCTGNLFYNEGECVECIASEDCEPGFLCTESVCVVENEEDNYGPDDAAVIELPFDGAGLTLSSDRTEEWFAFGLEADMSYNFMIDFDHSEGSLGLLLFPEGESLPVAPETSNVTSSTSSSDDGSLTYSVPFDGGGTYYLQVLLLSSEPLVYNLNIDTVTEESPEACGPENLCTDNLFCDEGECVECIVSEDCGTGFFCMDSVCIAESVEDNYDPEDAAVINLPFLQSCLTLSLERKEELLAFGLEADTEYIFTIDFEHSEGSLGLSLFPEGGSLALTSNIISNTSSSDNASFTYSVPSDGGGTYYLQVLLLSSEPLFYNLKIGVTAERSECTSSSCGEHESCENGFCVAKMATIPAGPFMMGCSERTDRNCRHWDTHYHDEVNVPEFEIDITEVTVAQYRLCVEDNSCRVPVATPPYDRVPVCSWDFPEQDTLPIDCISWYKAEAYCEWAGKRLCSEAEWEKAARGTDERIYPWGNEEPTCDLAIISVRIDSDLPLYNFCGAERNWPVASRPAGIYGLYDMTGNAYEWVADIYQNSYRFRDLVPPSDGSAWMDLRDCPELCRDVIEQRVGNDQYRTCHGCDIHGVRSGSHRSSLKSYDRYKGRGYNPGRPNYIINPDYIDYGGVSIRCCRSAQQQGGRNCLPRAEYTPNPPGY